MNPKFKPRELFLMTLPVLLLGGTALWLGSGGQMSASLLGLEGMVANARRPALTLKSVSAIWISPTRRAFIGNEKGCEVTAYILPSASLGQARPSNDPTFVSTDVVDDKGRSIKAILAKKRQFSKTTTYNGVLLSASSNSTTYSVHASIPFVHLPRGTRSAIFKGTIGWGTAKPIPVQFEVLPIWMRRPANRLHVQSVTWRPYKGNKGSEVEVVCRIMKPHNPYVFGLSEGGAIYTERIGIGYDPQEHRWTHTSPKDDVILGEWSQRIESGDGRLNSLDLLRDHMDKETFRTGGGYLGPLAESFDPLCKVSYAGVKNDVVRLTYDISGIPNTFKNPVFRCEIYLVGDGIVRVHLPLKTKDIKQAR